MSRIVRRPVTLFSFAFFLLAIPIWWHFRAPILPLPAYAQGQQHAADLEVSTIRAGLDAKALAAAGVSAQATTSLVQALNTYLLAHPADLSAADTGYANARRESDRLQRLIQSGQGSAEDVTSYQTQSAALASATTQRQTALDALFNAGTANLSEGQKATLSTIRANRASWDSPLEFLTVDRSQQEWVHLRDCLANERIAIELPDTLDQGMQAELATWRAVGAVASASTSLNANLASVTAAWNAAMHE
jgi:hypothetical protein